MHNLKAILPEIWGGIECTINRVNDRYMDQLSLSGIYDNTAFFNAIPDLKIKKIRFPILWEKHQPSLSADIDWTWTEVRLAELKLNDIEPIAGLLHHGSGPFFTNLLEDDFPELFAAYAKEVAAKFRWIKYYTPVNEPLTTARFSGLYGLWYPHKINDVSFMRILLNELKASILAMREIHKINPAAKFVQTEDLGKTYSTTLLKYQANFENNRRWLTYDILCGKFDSDHPLWNYAIRLGIEESKLQFFIENSCPPDIIGVNHYLTSERYLDENTGHYPTTSIGGNGLHTYADVEAIRVQVNEPNGLEHLLNEIGQRYNIPIAITEVHLNCTREEQLRWFNQVYEIAQKLLNEGVNIIAVTAWALFGSYGWNKLLTTESCDYEAGVFDISAGYARPTALYGLIKNINQQKKSYKSLLGHPGWWQLQSRFYINKRLEAAVNLDVKNPLIIIGKTGTLGKALSKLCTKRNIPHFLLGRDEADVCNERLLNIMIQIYRPWAIINTAGFTDVNAAEYNKDACYKVNCLGADTLAHICHQNGIKLLSYSSDLVFDGNQKIPYVETDPTNPLNTYGLTKQLAERAIFKSNPNALLIRTAAFFSPWDDNNFVHQLLNTLKVGSHFKVADDIFISPTYVPHLVTASLDLLIDNAFGTWHLVNKGYLSWYQFAKKILSYTKLNSALLEPIYQTQNIAKIPTFSALGSIKYNTMPALGDALEDYFSTVQIKQEPINVIN